MVTVDPPAEPEPRPRGKVVRRFTLTGPGITGDRYRITVADRSGRVIGARTPSEREIRFADQRWPEHDEVGTAPLVSLAEAGSNDHELLIRWGGTPCGPVATVDVARDLSAIRVIDRTPGCDASGHLYWLVLRLRGPWLDAEDIEGSRLRR